MKTRILISLTLFLYSCGPQYVQGPNAHVLVASKYENKPEKIIIPNNSKPQYNYEEKKGAKYALILYNNALTLIEEAKGLAAKKMYLSAVLSYTQALTHLIEAEIRLKKSKTINYEDYRIAVTDGLEKKIEEKIKFCKKQIFLLQWKHQ